MTDVTQLAAALADRYRLEPPIGRGGMATVYRARDLKHDRDVAVKVLHPELAAALGTERFLAEIRTTANLQHPNILPLFDSGEAAGLVYYVMPFVAGESLRERLVREQQLPVDTAVRLAEQVAGALEHAHKHGIVHRDIKPENILLSEGQALVADFGIALAVTHSGGARLTQSGISVGTPAYMSPEQASAEREVDRRTDIYALGAVLYEMLAGAPPYTGPTAAAITARKLTEPVPPLRTVRDTVPGALEAVIRKALARTPADRYATAQEFAQALAFARSLGEADSQPTVIFRGDVRKGRGIPYARLTLAAAALALGVACWVGFRAISRRGADVPVRVVVTTPPGTTNYAYLFDNLALSPDGSLLVFTAGRGDSTQLYLHPLDSFDVRPIPGTVGGDGAFFSADGRWIAFWNRDGRQLFKVPVAGGAPVLIGSELDVDAGFGVWAPNDTIYSTAWVSSSYRAISAAGGALAAHPLDRTFSTYFRCCMRGLPDGEHVLLGASDGGGTGHDFLYVLSLRTHQERKLLDHVLYAQYIDPGYLLYQPIQTSELWAVPFDIRTVKVTGAPVKVLDGVETMTGGEFVATRDGTLAYVPAIPAMTAAAALPGLLELVGTDGVVDPQRLPSGVGARFSPDGRSLIYSRMGRRDADLFVYDLASGSEQHFAGEDGAQIWSLFTPDGRHVVYNSGRGTRTFLTLDWRATDGSGVVDSLVAGNAEHMQPQTWARNGAELLYTRGPDDKGRLSIWTLAMDGSKLTHPLLAGEDTRTHPVVSRDGRWLAWVSDASGRFQVMAQRYPDGVDVQVSRDGGVEPVWAPDSRTLYFRNYAANRVFVTHRLGEDPLRFDAPRLQFTGSYQGGMPWGRAYDLSPDGRRFVMVKNPIEVHGAGYVSLGSEIRVIVHFGVEVERKMKDAARRSR